MRLTLPLILALGFIGCKAPDPTPGPKTAQVVGAAPPAADRPEPGSIPATVETRVEMVNVNIHLDPSLIVKIRRLSGKLVPTKKGQTPTFDDKQSYVIAVDSAEIAVGTASMTHLMNTYIFGDPDAPLRNLTISTEGGHIKQEGTIKKGPGIHFEMISDLSPTPDGKMRIHPTKTRAAHLPVKGLMKLFGVDMADLINTRHTRGIAVDDNDIILDAALALPPPKMTGRITAVRIEGDDIVQTFGELKAAAPGKKPASNYMAYRGGALKFGKLTMQDTDMRLIDADPSNPFDFSPDHYKEHLVSGYSKTTASGGLLVYMPDYGKFAKSLSPK